MSSCGKILPLKSVAGYMSISDFYAKNDEGSTAVLDNSAEPFSGSRTRRCSVRRDFVQNFNHRGRIVRRALNDKAKRGEKKTRSLGRHGIRISSQQYASNWGKPSRDNCKKSKRLPINYRPKLVCEGFSKLRETMTTKSLRLGNLRAKNNDKAIIRLRRRTEKFLEQDDGGKKPF